MAPQKNSRKTSGTSEKWQYHDSYDTEASFNRIVTRSQTAFIRLKNTPSDLDLFADSSRHQLPDAPHLMEKLKGEYGSIPRTIITRSYGTHVGIDDNLCTNIDEYKKFKSSEKVQGKDKNENDKEKKQQTSEDKKKKQVIEELKKKQAEEANKKKEAEEAKKKKEAEEATKKKEEEEAKKKKEAEEAKKKKEEDDMAEKKRQEAEEVEKREAEAEEEERKQKEDKDD